MDKKILDLTEATTVKSDHYIPVDHGTDGTQKMALNTLIDSTLATSGKAADAKATGEALSGKASTEDLLAETNAREEDIADLKSDLDESVSDLNSAIAKISGTTKNLFNPHPLEQISGWSFSGGVYSGMASALHDAYGVTDYPIGMSFDEQYYTLGLDAKISGSTTTGLGLQVKITYTDGTITAINVMNSASEWAHYVVKTYKPVAKINLTYGSGPNNIIYIKNIMLVPGLNEKDYIPYDTAVDYVVRETIDGIEQTVDGIEQTVMNQSATYDFSDKTIGATYVGIKMPIKLLSGATYKFIITAPETDENTEYFLFYDADNNRLIPSGIFSGSGSRTVTFENAYGKDAVLVEMVLAKVNAQSVYTVEFVNSDNINKDIDALDARVTVLENGSSPEMEIPEYFEANLASAISEAQTAMLSASINGETFVFLSDVHWENNEKHSPALVKAVTDALPIENTFYGGDTFNGGTQETIIGYMNDVRQKFTAASPHFLSVYGNHDGNQLDGGTAFQHDEFYTLLQKQSDYYVNYEAPCYYYMDNEATKTRFIVLDSRTGTPSTASAQISWLQSITANTPVGWHFIVFVHVIYYPGEGGAYDDPTTWVMSPFMTNVCTALDAVNTAGGKKVEAIFGGHCHIDYNSQTSGGIPIVMIDCDTKQTVSGNPQTAGTTGEQCLDIVTVNYSAEEIHCARIGRGVSRTINY